MFTPDQVKQFKEAFNMIDQDGDGRVTEDDLRVMLSNLGTSISHLQYGILMKRSNTNSNITQLLTFIKTRFGNRIR